MSELQSTIEFSIELFKFYNVDLFQRGMYQVRCCLRVSSKLSVEVEVTTPEVTTGLGSAIILGNYGACRPFQILYRNEEIILKDVVLFRCHMLVDAHNLKESLERAEFSILLELWFSDSSPASMVMVSSRTLQLNFSPIEGLHHHLPILFDYFHLSAISLTVHAALIALHQPSMKKGILRYVQSCAPKTSKSWSKIRSAHCTSLTDPVLPVSSHKVYSRINESPQVHLEAYNVLLDSSNNLKTIIKDYKYLLLQREETVSENYDTLVVKHKDYDSTKYLKKSHHHSGLAELCADNIRIWNYFLLTFSCKIAIQQHLSKKHHNLRVKRFAELFFIIYNPRRNAFGSNETNYQHYLVIAEIARRSKYMQMLPPLPIHCVALDGDSATMPVIFEDQYQDPYYHQKRNPEESKKDSWLIKQSFPTLSDTNCSCGIGNLWEHRKSSEKILTNPELDVSIPTRHSKSLDQLQSSSRNFFNYSLNNILAQKEFGNNVHIEKSKCYKIEKTLKNVASEHNIRNEKYFLDDTFTISSNSCNCPLDGCQTKKRKPELFLDLNQTNGLTYNIKNVIAKSYSPSTESQQNILRSNSEHCFAPKKRSLTNGTQNGHRKSKFEIGSTSSSTESLSDNIKTGLHTLQIRQPNIRKVRSTSCLGENASPLVLSGTESLPNITPKIENRLHYADLTCFSSRSTSSATSEQSGWITSRSSSLASSTEATNPATSALNLDSIQKKLLQLAVEQQQSKSDFIFNHRPKKCLGPSRIRHPGEFSLFKGCEFNQSNICDDIALPPPKQFRDFESPSSSLTNGTNNEEEINAVDNLLYHVVDTHTTLDRKSSQLNLNKATHEIEDFHFSKRPHTPSFKSFLKAKHDFKSQLKLPGALYSDMDSFASTAPYFHISDEFRIFSPEGMHLVVCVHGLDGNAADLRLVKTYLELGLPGAYLDFLMSERNQGDTFSDFDTMTDRLVSEILHYLDTSNIRPTRISFVGHSLGNVIIRSALTRPQMKFLLPRLHTFLSLSGPHLGTLYNSSGLVNMGMWFMQKWKKSGSLLQLCLKDAADARQTFLYRLSQRSKLHHFKNILLCGSGQDRYVPLHSARIELCKESIKDTSDQGTIYREMVHNIISPIIAQKELKLVRYDIHHALPNTANALIGRAAHIAVLDSELFIEKFMAVVGIKYFR